MHLSVLVRNLKMYDTISTKLCYSKSKTNPEKVLWFYASVYLL